jgi:hypothetical protein
MERPEKTGSPPYEVHGYAWILGLAMSPKILKKQNLNEK